MAVKLAGSDADSATLLSAVGDTLLRFFDTLHAPTLRLVCREFENVVREHPWEDMETVIKGSIASWRKSFPRALCANVLGDKSLWGSSHRRSAPVLDADLVHFVGLRELNMAGHEGITDAAFKHLRGIRVLNMSQCSGITDAGFEHLAGSIHTLDMSWCQQLTDAAFAHLRGIHTLDMSSCHQPTITNAAFAHLVGIKKLNMYECRGIGDAAFVHLRGIVELDMGSCCQDDITDAALAQLAGIRVLDVSLCSPNLTDQAFAPLRSSLRELNISTDDDLNQFSDAAFVHFGGLRKLNIANCNQDTITDAAFLHLRNIKSLDMSGCDQTTITDAAFEHLAGIQSLNMSDCTQDELTDTALTHLTGIKKLEMQNCTQLTGSTIAGLKGLDFLDISGCSMALICAAGAAELPIGDEEQEMYW